MVVSWQAINDGGDFDIGKHKIPSLVFQGVVKYNTIN